MIRRAGRRALPRATLAAVLLWLGCGATERADDAPQREVQPASAAGRSERVGGSVTEAAASRESSTGRAEEGGGAATEAFVRAPRADGDVLLIEVAEVHEKLASGAPVLVIDARNSMDFAREHVPGSINVPLAKIAGARDLPRIPPDYEIVVYCVSESCPISRNAARVLARLGYTNVKDMRAGLVGWKQAGFETVTPG